MIVRIGENKQEVATSGKYDAVNLNVYMIASAVNTALAPADFLSSFVTVKVVLRRDGSDYYLLQDNLSILGTFASLLNGYNVWTDGWDKIVATASLKNIKLRAVQLPFGGVHEVKPGDKLICEISVANGAFSANVDATNSNIDFTFNPAQGVELGIFQTRSEVIQTNTTNQSFSIGDNITKIALLNFDKTDYSSEVVSTLGLNSLTLDANYTFNQLLAIQNTFTDSVGRPAYGTAYPVVPGNKVYRGVDALPQSFYIYNGHDENQDLDDVKVYVSFNSANVAASQNYFVYRSYRATQQSVAAAQSEAARSASSKVKNLPVK